MEFLRSLIRPRFAEYDGNTNVPECFCSLFSQFFLERNEVGRWNRMRAKHFPIFQLDVQNKTLLSLPSGQLAKTATSLFCAQRLSCLHTNDIIAQTRKYSPENKCFPSFFHNLSLWEKPPYSPPSKPRLKLSPRFIDALGFATAHGMTTKMISGDQGKATHA